MQNSSLFYNYKKCPNKILFEILSKSNYQNILLLLRYNLLNETIQFLKQIYIGNSDFKQSIQNNIKNITI